MSGDAQVTKDANEQPPEIPSEDYGTLLPSTVTKCCASPMLAGEMSYMSSAMPKITKEQWTRQTPASSAMKVKRAIHEISD
uniref:Uncharacterized protein n=1 Tax=Lynx canadensis TaxID=61383 RepID=A0A667H909_LYNCA